MVGGPPRPLKAKPFVEVPLSNDEFEVFKRVEGARVVIADYALLKHDIPSLNKLTDSQIDDWLVFYAGVLSSQQLDTQLVTRREDWRRKLQTEVRVKPDPKSTPDFFPQESKRFFDLVHGRTVGFRPRGYNRAAVFVVGHSGQEEESWTMLDAKGIGVQKHATPNLEKGHSSGLHELGQAIREYAMQKMVHAVLQDAKHRYFSQGSTQTLQALEKPFKDQGITTIDWSKLPWSTVQTYAVLDLGFNVDPESNGGRPVGVVIRQAHGREGEFPYNIFALTALLLQYGITIGEGLYGTLDEKKNDPRDVDKLKKILYLCEMSHPKVSNEICYHSSNIQTDMKSRLVDFGSLMVHGDELRYSFVAKTFPEAKIRDMPIILRDSFKPSNKVSVPREGWGFDQNVPGCFPAGDPRCDQVSTWGDRLALEFRAGRATKETVASELDARLSPVLKKLSEK